MKNNISINILNKVLSFLINSPATLKHLFAFTENGGNVSRQLLNLLRAFGKF